MADTVHTELHDGQDWDIGGEERSSLLTWLGTITGPTSYTQGGIEHPNLPTGATIVHVQSGVVKDHYIKWSGGTLKFEFFVSSTDAEAAGTTDLDEVTIPVTIYYRK